jgi:hypothetical protein
MTLRISTVRPCRTATLGFALAGALALGGLSVPAAADQPNVVPNSQRYRNQGVQPQTGRSGSAALTVRALQGKDSVTDLELTTGALDSPAPAPGSISGLQIKTLLPNGAVDQTTNDNRLDRGGYLAYRLDSVACGQDVEVQANICGIDGSRTDMVRVTTKVARRPNLQPLDLQVSGTAIVQTPVQIAATVREVNLDVGARANAVLYVDGQPVDTVTNLWVDAAGSVSVLFTHAFATLGTKQLGVALEQVVPRDDDPGDNTLTGSIQIVPNTQPLRYYAAFGESQTYAGQGSSGQRYSPYFAYESRSQEVGWRQSAFISFWISAGMALPLERVSFSETSDGSEVLSVSLDLTHSEDSGIRRASGYDAGSNTFFWLTSSGPVGGGGWTQGECRRLATDVVYWSSTAYYLWSGWDIHEVYTHNLQGTRLPVGSVHGLKLLVKDGSDTEYVADPEIPITLWWWLTYQSYQAETANERWYQYFWSYIYYWTGTSERWW